MNSRSFSSGSGVPPLMAHLVAGYPDQESSFTVARALCDGGAAFLEVQFPFSDPSADGPAIQEACTVSLSGGFRTDDGFNLVKRVTASRAVPLFIMSYANVVYRRGIRRFVKDAAASGARGLIVPDLPPDSDEGLFAAGKDAGLLIVPVVAPDISAKRLGVIAGIQPEYIYTALRTGVTGMQSVIDEKSLKFLSSVRAAGSGIMAGFGIRSFDQLAALAGFIDIGIAGSVFVETIRTNVRKTPGELYDALRLKAGELCGVSSETASPCNLPT